ncbi:hypothetical protein JDW19_21555 [Paenibacillus polymyxa]|uniref:Aminoacyl-transfer RNA synthetases class-II family profile domain-containing protein n=1 Tax=Paenibacillus polymyxa TaxID=1406 RepID=A0A8I1LXB1_PAEPO|nr:MULTISPECIES: hypothetical protein [Paenibacillus]KAF6569875.1 hypothetical protein G9G53_21580 [Paenibacillus sp. EKM206P]KAF6585404.1 hypothetical protein G9G52_22670 [Paenibacillus sp. EKM205P]MBM0635697.1 hypothetical protein [Paenibacillus polymyxa]
MKQVIVPVEKEPDEELKRMLGFAGEKIVDIQYAHDRIELTLKDDAEPHKLLHGIRKMITAYDRVISSDEVLFSVKRRALYYKEDQLMEAGLVRRYGEGLISLAGSALKLYEFLDRCFLQLLEGYETNRRKYPVLLPLTTYTSTRYLATSPQYAMFCCPAKESMDDISMLQKQVGIGDFADLLDRPKYAFSPSACFHLYEELRGETLVGNTIYTFRQNVFRNEGRFNWGELTRLRDYTVREVVFIGDDESVYEFREDMTGRILQLLEQLELDFEIRVASDPFIVPEMQKYKTVQARNRLKYECKIVKDDSSSIACASLNMHGPAFSQAFQFSVNGKERTASGCIGFGLERWVIAFLLQHGCDEEAWPDEVRKGIALGDEWHIAKRWE